MKGICIRHNQWGRGAGSFLVVVVWMGMVSAGAQQTPKPKPVLVPRSIILPSRLVAGAPATLAVLDSQGRLLPGATVELPGGMKTVTNAAGRAVFKAPDTPGNFVAKISPQGVSASVSVIAAELPSTQPAADSESPPVFVRSYPHVLATHDRFVIEGSGFRGEADADRVFLADRLCFVLAASPTSLVVLPGPNVPIGDVTLRLIVDGRNAGQFTVSSALLEFTGPEEAPNAGGSGTLTLHAHGTSKRLVVEVRNASPGIVQLLKGNPTRVTTSGGEENIASVDVKFLTAGSYVVLARLISAETAQSQPNVESARKRLVEARGVATGTWTARIDRVLLKIDSEPLDLAQIRADLRSLLDDKPDASLASLLNSAWQELQQKN